MKYPDFANRFREAVRRAEVDDTQEALAKLLGVSGVMIWSYRNGEKLPRMSTALRIAGKLGVEVNWLLSGSGDKGSGSGAQVDPAAEEAAKLMLQLLPGELAYIKEQANHLIARRMQGAPPATPPATPSATPPGLQNLGSGVAEDISAVRQEKEDRERNTASFEARRKADLAAQKPAKPKAKAPKRKVPVTPPDKGDK